MLLCSVILQNTNDKKQQKFLGEKRFCKLIGSIAKFEAFFAGKPAISLKIRLGRRSYSFPLSFVESKHFSSAGFTQNSISESRTNNW